MRDAVIAKAHIAGVARGPGGQLHTSWSFDYKLSLRYECLIHFDKQSALPFRLQDVIEDVLEPFTLPHSGPFTNSLISFLDALSYNFDKWFRIAPLLARVVLIKAERDSIEDLDVIKRMMGSHAATTTSIMQACLRNGCRTVTPIKYGIAHVEGFGSSLQTFVVGLLTALLAQPYRGIMLRELDQVLAQDNHSINFRQLLASAVEGQGEFYIRPSFYLWIFCLILSRSVSVH